MDTLPSTSYVSRVVALPSGVARQVFEACRADRQLCSYVAARATFVADDGDGPSVPGTLHVGRLGGSYAVELELSPWSAACSELGLRLTGRRRPSERYLDGAGAVVDALASELELRGLLALHPSHLTGTATREVAASAWL